MAANESLITDAAAPGISSADDEDKGLIDIRFGLAIVTTLVALLLIAFSKFH